jgi:hypothetical protein
LRELRAQVFFKLNLLYGISALWQVRRVLGFRRKRAQPEKPEACPVQQYLYKCEIDEMGYQPQHFIFIDGKNSIHRRLEAWMDSR